MLQDIAQAIKDTAKEQIADIHTAIPARVVSFDAASCTATVKPYGLFRMGDGTTLEFPEITQAPVALPYSSSSGAAVAVPVMAGDDVLLLFPETELEAWRTESMPQGSMRFDLSNAIVLPGLMRSNALMSVAASQNAVVVGTPSVYIAVTSSGVTINGDVTVNGSIYADNWPDGD